MTKNSAHSAEFCSILQHMKLRHITIHKLPSMVRRIQVHSKSIAMGGPSDRTMKTQHAYNIYRQSSAFTGDCVYCSNGELDITDSHTNFWIVASKFKYEIWDDHPVTEHYLLIPKRHVVVMKDFTGDESTEYFRLLSQYESEGYSIYSRAPTDPARSVAHFHTHFLKIGAAQVDAMVYLRKPHVVLHHRRKTE